MDDIQNQLQEAIDELVESGRSVACRSPCTGMASRWPTPSLALLTRRPGVPSSRHAFLLLLGRQGCDLDRGARARRAWVVRLRHSGRGPGPSSAPTVRRPLPCGTC